MIQAGIRFPALSRLLPSSFWTRNQTALSRVVVAVTDSFTVALAVIAENAGGGSKVAAPIARKLLDTFLLTPQQKEQLIAEGDPSAAEISPSLMNINKLRKEAELKRRLKTQTFINNSGTSMNKTVIRPVQ